jgi:hypothetical protein
MFFVVFSMLLTWNTSPTTMVSDDWAKDANSSVGIGIAKSTDAKVIAAIELSRSEDMFIA